MRCPACKCDNIAGVDLCEDCGLDLAGLDVKAWGVSPDDPIIAPAGRHPAAEARARDRAQRLCRRCHPGHA